jgi:uroporphyrinogen decarboxylase
MKSLERVINSLLHKETDRVPLFYRGIPEVEKRLLNDLNLKNRDELLNYLEIDFRWVGPKYAGPPLEGKDEGHKYDIWGVEHRYKKINNCLGYWEVVKNNLLDVEKPEDLQDYTWPKLEWFDFSQLKDDIKKYRDFAIMTYPDDFSSPGILSTIQSLLGLEKTFADMLINPEFFDALVEKILDFRLSFIDKMLSEAGGGINFFRIGDDYGGQDNMMLSPELWRKRIKPALKKMADLAKRHGAYYYHHSCGSVRPIIPDFIEIGLDVLDPIQVTAKGMNPAELKKEFGNSLCFSGGADEQHLLRVGSADDVRKGVKELLDIMAPGGGFFIGSTHNFQTDIPTENILAMYKTAREWAY